MPYPPPAAVSHSWLATGQGARRCPARVVGVAPVPRPLPAGARWAVRRRVWAWRLLLTAWTALTGLVTVAGLRWVGVVSLCCPLPMAVLLPAFAWCAAADVRVYRAELRERH